MGFFDMGELNCDDKASDIAMTLSQTLNNPGSQFGAYQPRGPISFLDLFIIIELQDIR